MASETTIGQAAATAIEACPHCGANNRVPAAASGRVRCGRCHRDLPWVVDATDDDFEAVADQARLTVLVDLWAPWCGPCRIIAPAIEQVASQLAGRLKVVKVNVDLAPQVAARFQARSIPTLVLLKGGHEVDRRVGALNAADLHAWIGGHLEGSGDHTGHATT